MNGAGHRTIKACSRKLELYKSTDGGIGQAWLMQHHQEADDHFLARFHG
jgi:hypothetical protein